MDCSTRQKVGVIWEDKQKEIQPLNSPLLRSNIANICMNEIQYSECQQYYLTDLQWERPSRHSKQQQNIVVNGTDDSTDEESGF